MHFLLKSFVVGMGSAFAFFPQDLPDYLTTTDMEAMRGDWMAIGGDIASGISRFSSEHPLPAKGDETTS